MVSLDADEEAAGALTADAAPLVGQVVSLVGDACDVTDLQRAAAEAKQREISVDQVWAERAAVYPPGRVVTPEEVAETIVFLCGDEASGVNGEAITVALGSIW